jgi:hypothetical protein
MSRVPLIAATTALLLVGVGSEALADGCTGPFIQTGSTDDPGQQYQGYSKKLAKKLDAPGNSAAVTSIADWVLECTTTNPNGTQTISHPLQYNITEKTYSGGPGNSPFDKKTQSTCVLYDTASIPCPF